MIERVAALYELRPYPPVGILSPFLQPVRRDDLPLLNYHAGFAATYGNTSGAAERPRIIVAGCGTLEAVAVALANPGAEVIAVDLSAHALKKLQWQARMRGVHKQIRTLQADLQSLPEAGFDYVIATGVLHHLPDPSRGLAALVERSTAQPLFRFMVYSRFGRELLYGAKELGEALGIKDPASFRRMIAALPPSHPFRVYFHLYSDAVTDTGLADGYLHPCDQPFDALSLRSYLSAQGLRASLFLHKPSGHPGAAGELGVETADDFEKLAVLDALSQLEENFCFFAGRGAEEGAPGKGLVWNKALPTKGALYSRLLGEKISFDQAREPGADSERLKRALFLHPGER